MAAFLGHFYDLTVRVSSSLHVTSNNFLFEVGNVHILVINWMSSTDPLQKAMAERMKEKFDKYWGSWHENEKVKDKGPIVNERGKGKKKEKEEKEKENLNLLIFIAAALDPRYKLSDFTRLTTLEIFGVESREKVWYAVNKCVRELFEEYRVRLTTPEPTTPSISQVTIEGGGASMMKELIASRLRQNNSGGSASSKSELEKYLAEDSEDPDKKIDILGWWKENSSRFPMLANMARDILAIPITTVASESAFSTSGRILDDFRTSLTPFMVQALVCTQDWLRRSTDPYDIKENLEELEELEKGKSVSQLLHT